MDVFETECLQRLQTMGRQHDWCDVVHEIHRSQCATTTSIYTPAWFARSLIPSAVHRRDHGLRILDPAVGCGRLLYESALLLQEAGNIKKILCNSLYGQDIDVWAVSLARVALCQLADPVDRSEVLDALRRHIRVADALTDDENDWPDTLFDVVVCNPPWINLSLTPEQGVVYRKHIASQRFPLCATVPKRNQNACHFFIERTIMHLAEGGRFLFILPDSMICCKMCCYTFTNILRLDCIWCTHARNVWPALSELGVVAIMGSKPAHVQPYTYFYSKWPTSSQHECCWTKAHSVDAMACVHLQPNSTWMRVLERCTSRYADVPWKEHRMGPAITNDIMPEGSTESVRVHRGSVFHLRYVCDTFPCFPHKNWGYDIAHRQALSSATLQKLLCPDRPPVVVLPLFMDRHHHHREQLRACFLPIGTLVDDSTCIHHVRCADPQQTLAYFLLGFWNSRVVEHLLIVGFLSPSGRCIRYRMVDRLPFPEIDHVEMLSDEASHRAQDIIQQCAPDAHWQSQMTVMTHAPHAVLACIVSILARDMEDIRYRLMRTLQEHTPSSTTAERRWSNWAVLTGSHRRPGIVGEHKHTPQAPSIEEYARCGRREIQWKSSCVDVALGVLYGFTGEEMTSFVDEVCQHAST